VNAGLPMAWSKQEFARPIVMCMSEGKNLHSIGHTQEQLLISDQFALTSLYDHAEGSAVVHNVN